ncbi:MAG TPA: alpha/beta fold hydrolase [Nocardioides sp.]|uniref:alpha/beta fold hydrolase n=1 Tax=Nocardioides sp. TaxID=35761 RepID=UPI002E37AC68|nr:alpha/beta fold hydrolase [Nocardioides sp.]HEX3929441.1 alpha/beta fold hydrolase [Nocardioides sp.]
MVEGTRIDSFRHDSLTFDVVDGGPRDAPAVVLLHGFPERASHWQAVSTTLHAHGLRTLAPDQRGYSPGARPRGRYAYRLSRLVADVVALVGRYGGPVHLVGHDWGAAVAWATAGARPDLVRSLTTVSVPHPAAFTRSLVSSDQARRSWYMLAFQPPGLVELVARRSPERVERFLGSGGLTADEVARFRTEIVEYGALPGALAWYRALPFSLRTSTGRIRVPTTHVWSDRDVALARRGAELTADFVRAPYELVVLTGVDHWVPTHAPDSLGDAILARVASAGDPR